MAEQQIVALPCWSGAVTLKELGGGITNRNYVVDDGDRRFVARQCSPLPHLGIHRSNEVACQRLAAELGFAPAIHYFEDSILVSDFVQSETLTAEAIRDASLLVRLAKTLRRLHDAWDQLEGELIYFSPLQTVRTYAATARRLGALLPEDIDEAIDQAARLMHGVSPFTPALCHNDLLAENILDAGDRLWLVDWEYAGIGNPLFDLANASGNSQFTEEQEQIFLTAYRGECIDSDLRDLRILKTISLLREALWAYIQTKKSDLEFDYEKYASENLNAYHEARQTL